MKSDIQIAHETELERIENVAAKIGINANDLEHYGKYIAKLPLDLIGEQKGKLILVTAITATKAGIGKTTVSIGLALGLNKIGKKAVVALREPSLGPCFGMKGGAAGGGYAQVLPMEKICSLLSYVNGQLDIESDDSIDDSQLYFAFLHVAAKLRDLAADQEAFGRALEESLADYREPFPGAKQRVEQVLRVMLTAWASAQLQREASAMLDEMNIGKGE